MNSPPPPKYFDLTDTPDTNGWKEYLRKRLPYSFEETERRDKDNTHVLKKPVFDQSPYRQNHNYWMRGGAFYVSAKIMDAHQTLMSISSQYKYGQSLLYTHGYPRAGHFVNVMNMSNAMQTDKLLLMYTHCYIEAERSMMTNLTHALELCLKAISTHVNYEKHEKFEFREGHNLQELYNDFPQSLREEIKKESIIYIKEYGAFREHVRKEIVRISKRNATTPKDLNDRASNYGCMEGNFAKIAHDYPYTVFFNDNDPTTVVYGDGSLLRDNLGKDEIGTPLLKDDWLEKAFKKIEPSQNHKYNSGDYRTDLIHSALILARFFYEHLFPTPYDKRMITPYPVEEG